jgi:hypothetical protein
MGAEKENTHRERRPEGKEGRALIRKASIPSRLANLSVESTLSPSKVTERC